MRRRTLLQSALLTGGALAVPAVIGGSSGAEAQVSEVRASEVRGAPALVRRGRPALTHGIQSGDVGTSSATIWTRADGPARMLVEVSRRPDFRHARRLDRVVLSEDSDFTGKTLLTDLPAGADLHYRVTAVDPHDHRRTSEPLVGRLRTVPAHRRDVSFLWSGDLAGQGWGIDPDRGGYRIFDAMSRLDPDFYICNGDNIYSDDPIEAEVALPDGTTWRNIVTEEKSKVAETLTEYRGQYKYNLIDQNLRRFYADVAQIQQWDDHETHNNWYPGEILDDPLYTEKRVDVLTYRARQAWHEYTPIQPRYDRENRIYRVLHHGPMLDVFVLDMRWYRDANSPDKQTSNDGGILGFEQARWLERELARSTATWKIISNDMPLGIVVPDTTQGKPNFEAVSQGDPGLPLGRERQIAELLRFIKNREISNVVWLTTDVHYTAAQYFDPDKAAFSDFDPFWQFVSGPLNAGSFPPDAIDATFGCQQVYVKSPSTANASPATEFQFFGQVCIDAVSRDMTVRLRDNSGTVLHTQRLHPAR